MNNGFLTLVAATTSFEMASAMESQNTFLGVGATVVRPVEMSRPLISVEGTVLIRNTAAIEINAVGATVSQTDEDATIFANEGTSFVAIELIY